MDVEIGKYCPFPCTTPRDIAHALDAMALVSTRSISARDSFLDFLPGYGMNPIASSQGGLFVSAGWNVPQVIMLAPNESHTLFCNGALLSHLEAVF